MASPTLKDLRTTYRVLSHLDVEVPQPLMVALAERIKATEKRRLTNRISRMTEEDLIRFQDTPRRRLRINLPDGRIVQEKTNEATFYSALKEADPARILQLDLSVRRHPLMVGFNSERKLLPGHKLVAPGIFVYRSIKPEERLEILRLIDQRLELNWTIVLI